DQVCNGVDPGYVCFLHGTSNQLFGSPTAVPNTNAIPQGGFRLGGARILVGYDRQLLQNAGLTLGLRLGYAFGGPSSPENVDANGNPKVMTNIGPAKGFLPFHGEVRLAYYFLGGMMADKKFRPYLFAGGGLGQVNASVPVSVCDSKFTAGEA